MIVNSNYWNRKVDEVENEMMERYKSGRCASCNVKSDYLFDYKPINDSEFIAKVCGCCLNRYQEIDKWRVD